MSTYPSIVLRKGKTEIKIENAAAIVKKINDICPSQDTYSWLPNVNKIKRELSDADRERQKRWMVSAKNWFKEEVFGGLDGFEVIVDENPKVKKTSLTEDALTIVDNDEIPTININVETDKKTISPIRIETCDQLEKYFNSKQEPEIVANENSTANSIQTVNKNAYEIRLEILKEAIQWSHRNTMATEQDVLNTAKKFYSFVENRR